MTKFDSWDVWSLAKICHAELDVRIQAARLADINSLILLLRSTASQCLSPLLGDSFMKDYLKSDSADEYVRERLRNCSILRANGVVAGFVFVRLDYIELIMVAPELHRRGLGTRLMDFAEQKLFEKFAHLNLESFEVNRQANSFFLKRGWRTRDYLRDEESGHVKIQMFKKAARKLTWT